MSTLPLEVPGRFAVMAPVARAWRGITRRHVRYAILVGAAVGTVQGFGYALWGVLEWWRAFLLMLAPTIVQALLLLVALAMAAEMRPARVPRWIPFVTAGALTAVIGLVMDQTVIGPLLTGPAAPPSTLPWYTVVWFNLPSVLMMAVLASLAYMHFVHESQSTRALTAIRIAGTRAARAAYESRLLALRARVDPTFLLETLRDVDRLYDQDDGLGQRMLDHLIVFLRAALPTLDGPSSTVDKELSLVQAWLDIMRMRHGDRVAFRIDVDDRAARAAMPAMVVLPLLAGTIRDGDAPFALSLTVAAPDARLRISVSIEGQGASHSAMEGVRESVLGRLRVLYGSHASVSVARPAAQRSEAVVEIPLEHPDRDHR